MGKDKDKLDAMTPGYQNMVDDIGDVTKEVKDQNSNLVIIVGDLNNIEKELKSQDNLIGDVKKDTCCNNIIWVLTCKFCCISNEDSLSPEAKLARRKEI
jgi:hypothetical protein